MRARLRAAEKCNENAMLLFCKFQFIFLFYGINFIVYFEDVYCCQKRSNAIQPNYKKAVHWNAINWMGLEIREREKIFFKGFSCN